GGALARAPTVSYQWGNYDVQAQRTNGTVGKVNGDASAWLFDVIASYQLGPLLLEARGTYSTGNKARDNLSLSKRYYEPLDLDTGFWSGGWARTLRRGGQPRQLRRRGEHRDGHQRRLRPVRPRLVRHPSHVQPHAIPERLRRCLTELDGREGRHEGHRLSAPHCGIQCLGLREPGRATRQWSA